MDPELKAVKDCWLTGYTVDELVAGNTHLTLDQIYKTRTLYDELDRMFERAQHLLIGVAEGPLRSEIVPTHKTSSFWSNLSKGGKRAR